MASCAFLRITSADGPARRHAAFHRALEWSQRVMFSLGPQAGKFELTMDVTCRTPEDAVVLKNQLEGITNCCRT